jgi:hypothetical protein
VSEFDDAIYGLAARASTSISIRADLPVVFYDADGDELARGTVQQCRDVGIVATKSGVVVEVGFQLDDGHWLRVPVVS